MCFFVGFVFFSHSKVVNIYIYHLYRWRLRFFCDDLHFVIVDVKRLPFNSCKRKREKNGEKKIQILTVLNGFQNSLQKYTIGSMPLSNQFGVWQNKWTHSWNPKVYRSEASERWGIVNDLVILHSSYRESHTHPSSAHQNFIANEIGRLSSLY